MFRSPFLTKTLQPQKHQFFASSVAAVSSPFTTTALRSSSSTASASSAAAVAADDKPKKEGFLNETKKEKLVLGALGATATSTSVIAVCHLLVCQVPATVALGSVAGAALTGALGVFEGEGSGGTGFGSAIGIFLGAVGAWYAKSSNEPWSKTPAKK